MGGPFPPKPSPQLYLLPLALGEMACGPESPHLPHTQFQLTSGPTAPGLDPKGLAPPRGL